MSTDKMLVEYQAAGGMVRLTPGIVRKYLMHGKAELVTDAELVLFMSICKYQGLNPFVRDCYLIKFSTNEPASIVVGKDTFTKRAASIPECAGYNAGVVVRRKDGGKAEIVKRPGAVVYDGEELVGGWARALRKGWVEPVEVEVSLKEYMRYSAKGEPTKSWRTMPASMIRKVALVQALREAFPDRYAALYSPEEMPIDDSRLPTEPVRVPETETVTDTISVQAEQESFEAPGVSEAFDKAGEKLPGAEDAVQADMF